MPKNEHAIEPLSRRQPAHEYTPSQHLQNHYKISDRMLAFYKLFEIEKLIFIPNSIADDAHQARIIRALELFESLEPADGAEGMLAAQMVGTHTAALECLKRAANPNQSIEGHDKAMKHAQKLMTLYTQQLATLDKHRGKGQQKMTVEHVNVESGGRAIVGHVEAKIPASERQVMTEYPLEHHETFPPDGYNIKPPTPKRNF